MRNSALASAALTSVALLAQTANAAPGSGDEAPSREEVSRRVSSLYDQAESDTGTFNATRAAATRTRGRADRPTDGERRPAAPARTDEAGRGGPALDDVARQWFDAARSKLGPTVAAALPRDRMPDRTGARPARPAERATAVRTEPGRTPSGRPALELPAAPVAELTAAPATGTAAVAELTAGPLAALPAPAETARETTQIPAAVHADAGTQGALALSAPAAESQQRSALKATKERNQLKIDRARALLTAHVAQQNTPLPALEAQSAPTPPTDTWSTSPAPLSDTWTTPRTTAPDTWATPRIPAADTWDSGPIPTVDRWESAPAQPTDTWNTRPAQAIAAAQNTTPTPATGTWNTTPSPAIGTGTTPALAPDPWSTTPTPAPAPTATWGSTPAPSDSSTGTQWQVLTDLRSADERASVSDDLIPAPAAAATGSGAAIRPVEAAAPAAAATATHRTPAPSGPAPMAPPQDTRAARALDFARAQLGKPCVWGTSGPDAYDAAGLTRAAWKAAGITLPRTPQEQATAGRGIAVAAAEPGDLVLFHAGHVGICSGNGMMIHAPGPGAVIREESIHYAGESAVHSVIRPA